MVAGTDGHDAASLSRLATMQFPHINYASDGHFDASTMKMIGVVVFKAFKDVDNGGKIGFELLESFIGSLDRHARDPITNADIFIDDVVNSSSRYIALFSNVD